jgi:hypothetical protein
MNGRHVIVGLLEYAIRSGPFEGNVTLRSDKHGDYMLRQVRGTGIGVSPALRA